MPNYAHDAAEKIVTTAFAEKETADTIYEPDAVLLVCEITLAIIAAEERVFADIARRCHVQDKGVPLEVQTAARALLGRVDGVRCLMPKGGA